MARMVRKQVYIRREHDELLKRRAAQLGVTESELIRQGIEAIGRMSAPVLRDEQAWQELVALMEARAVMPPETGEARRWSREEMYDERWTRRLPR